MRVIRGRARRDAVDPERVGMMGFSAGGHVCTDLATRFARVVYDPVDASDRLSARPFVAAPIYPVQSMHAPLAHPGSRALLIGANASRALESAHRLEERRAGKECFSPGRSAWQPDQYKHNRELCLHIYVTVNKHKQRNR